MKTVRPLFVTAALIALTGFGCFTQTSPMPPTEPTAATQAYQDPSRRFTFNYAPEMDTVEDVGLLEPYHFLSDAAIGMTSDVSSYHPMNYHQDIWFVVSTKSTDEATCYAPIDAGFTAAFDGRQTIGGHEFRIATMSDAGAGNRYETTVYRTFDNGTCYEVATTLHSSSDWTNVDEAAIARSQETAVHLLDAMAASFRIL